MQKYGFVYLWYDRKRKMYYIGCHWGTVDDGYICSSKRMRDAYRRRTLDFKRRILKRNISKESLLEEEYKWLQLIKDDELGKKYYNLRKEGFNIRLSYHNKKEQIEKFIDSRSRLWKVEYPDGHQDIVKNLKQFCKDNNLDYRNFHRLLYNNRRNSHRKFKLLGRLTSDPSRKNVIKSNNGMNINKKDRYVY